MQKSNFFKGFAIVNFVFFVALFLGYQTGKLDRFFTTKAKTIETAETMELDRTTLSSSKSMPVAQPTRFLRAIKTTLLMILGNADTAFSISRDTFITKELEHFYIKKRADSIEAAKRVFMSSSKSVIIDGPKISSKNLPPAPDIDSPKK